MDARRQRPSACSLLLSQSRIASRSCTRNSSTAQSGRSAGPPTRPRLTATSASPYSTRVEVRGGLETLHAGDDRLTAFVTCGTYSSAVRTKNYGRSVMPSSATKRAAQVRAERREHRVMIDGRMVSTIAPDHGIVWIYLSYSCRCHPCTTANSDYIKAARKRNYEGRVKDAEGRWFYPPGPHGSASTYVTRGCHCAPCTEAIRVVRAENRRK